jgi:hypothetical protein
MDERLMQEARLIQVAPAAASSTSRAEAPPVRKETGLDVVNHTRRALPDLTLEYADLVTDIIAMIEFWVQGSHGTFWAVLSVILLTMAAQLLLTFLQYKKDAKKKLVFEMIVTLVFLRPFVNAYRADLQRTKPDSQTVDDRSMLVFSRALTAVFETMPQVFIQWPVVMPLLASITGRPPSYLVKPLSLHREALAFIKGQEGKG